MVVEDSQNEWADGAEDADEQEARQNLQQQQQEMRVKNPRLLGALLAGRR